MLVSLLLSYSFFTKEYRFGLPVSGALDAVRYGGGFMYSLSSDSFPALMEVDSSGSVLAVRRLPPALDKVRRLKVLYDALWGGTGTKALRILWPDSAKGINFSPDTVVSVLPLGGDTAVVLLFVPFTSYNFYRLVLIAGDSVLSASDLVGVRPNNWYGFGDMGDISSGAIILAVLEGENDFYVASVNPSLSGISWVKKVELPSYLSILQGDLYLDVLPDGKIVVAYTVDSASYTRWAYTLLSPSGDYIETRMLYPTLSSTSHHYVWGVRALSGGRIAIFGSLSAPGTYGGVVIVDTSGSVLSSYAFASSSYISGLTYDPAGYTLLGTGTGDSTVVFLRQTSSFGPCDTLPVTMATATVSASVSEPTVSISPSGMFPYSRVRYSFTSALLPSTSTPCSTSVSTSDTIPPTVLSTYPANGAVDVPESTTVVVVFSEAIDTATFNTSNVSLSPSVAYYPSCLSPDTCIITHSPFPTDVTVTVSLSSEITDTASNSLTPYSFSFSTRSSAPTTDTPRVILTSPDSGEINVPLNVNIGVWFSSPVDTTTVRPGNVRIRGWDGSSVATYTFTRTCPTSLFCVLNPFPRFRPAEEVAVRFTAGITDISGTVSIVPRTVIFRTQEVDTSRPVVVFTLPDSGATGVPTNSNVGVQFSKSMDTTTLSGNVSITGSVSGSHGYFVSCPSDDYCTLDPYPDFSIGEEVVVEFSDRILSRDGYALVPKTVIFSTGGGSDTVPPTVQIVAPPNDTLVVFNAGEIIRAYVSDGGSGIQRVDWVLGSSTYSAPTNCEGGLYSDPDTSCLSMPALSGGTYLLKAIAFDRSSNAAYDSVWVVFNDTVPPYLVLTEPSNGDVGVSPHTDIRLVFSESMDTSTFGSVSITVGSTAYTYSHVWENMEILRLSPSSPFPYDSVVRVAVSSFTDLAGNAMVPDTFSFRIVSNASVSATVISVSPDTIYVGSGDSVEVRGVVLSTYPIVGADLILDGDSSIPMVAIDGAYDEVEETVAVKIYTEKEGTHTVVIRGRNAYDYGASPTANFYVLKVPFLSKDNVVVYPNPTKGMAKVRFILGDDAYASIEVFDLKSRRVFHKEDMYRGFRTHTVDLPNLPPGLYLLRIKAKGQKVEKWFSVVR